MRAAGLVSHPVGQSASVQGVCASLITGLLMNIAAATAEIMRHVLTLCTPHHHRSHHVAALAVHARLTPVIHVKVIQGSLGSHRAAGVTWLLRFIQVKWINHQRSRSTQRQQRIPQLHMHPSHLCLRSEVGRAVHARAVAKCGCGVRDGLLTLHVAAGPASLDLTVAAGVCSTTAAR